MSENNEEEDIRPLAIKKVLAGDSMIILEPGELVIHKDDPETVYDIIMMDEVYAQVKIFDEDEAYKNQPDRIKKFRISELISVNDLIRVEMIMRELWS